MRKVVLGVGISLDGYIARVDGGLDFLFMPKDYSNAQFFKTIDTTLMGRKTYEVAMKMGGPPKNSNMAMYVFSRSLPQGERQGMIFVDCSPAELVGRLRKTPGKDIWLSGGGELVRDFLKADLVDEIHLGIVPTLIGEGIPLFPAGFPQREFLLIANETYAKGMVVLKYKRVRPKTTATKKK
jgi:dihydrofolate reductase